MGQQQSEVCLPTLRAHQSNNRRRTRGSFDTVIGQVVSVVNTFELLCLVAKWRIQKGSPAVSNPLPVQGVRRDPLGWKVSTILLFSNGESGLSIRPSYKMTVEGSPNA